MKDDLLFVSVLTRDDAGPANLRTCSGGGRHCNDRSDAVGICTCPPAPDVFETPNRPGLRYHEGHTLPDVERRAAANGNDGVMAASAKGSNSCVKVCLRWIALHVREDFHLNSCIAEALDDASDQRRAGKSPIGYQQRLGGIVSATAFGKLSNSSSPGDDACRKIPCARAID